MTTIRPGEEWDVASRLLESAGTWEELRGDLDRLGILATLDADRRRELAERWERREAARLSDQDLTRDLAHWAHGRGQADHPLGFNAPKPATLVAEAQARGWFCQNLPGGKTLVNPPLSKPLVIPPIL
jgi:hypothetical protein